MLQLMRTLNLTLSLSLESNKLLGLRVRGGIEWLGLSLERGKV